MKKCFSSSYTTNKENWVIISNDQDEPSNTFKESSLYGIYCVVQNIIQRGSPTEPSEYLKSKLGKLEVSDSIRFFSEYPTQWNKTIKGDSTNSDYPAADFFNKVLPEQLGEYSFVRNLIVPEASFDDILGKHTAFSGQQVDFYLPQLSLVIEIDGAQHQDPLQSIKDKKREEELSRNRIDTERIEAKEIKNDSYLLKVILKHLRKRISECDTLLEYKEALTKRPSLQICRYETVLRLQVLLLTCLRNQQLDINNDVWKIKVLDSDIESIDELLDIAYSDLKLWIGSIADMMKINLSFPRIEITNDIGDSDICIDFSLFKRYDDTCMPHINEYIIRTDYYSGKDYYQVAVSELLRYKLELEEPSKDIDSMRFLLRNLFGFDSFQDGQIPIIANVLEGSDTIGILPTGAGKSLCYQFCALLQPGVTLIVDPILSLMQDQKRSMFMKKITHNEMISSNMGGQEREAALEKLRKGFYQMVWISPERFQNEQFRVSLAEINRCMNLCYAVIDEVHCLSEWGHDFRISYLTLIKTIREHCPAAVLLGLTATASEFVLADIRAEFGDAKPLEWTNVKTKPSMDRPELVFNRIRIRDESERKTVIRELIKRKLCKDDPQSGLIFCPTVNGWYTSCNAVSDLLSPDFDNKYRVFNGQMSSIEKEANQAAFMEEEFPLMICTKAFGMGVDKQNLRFTIHDSLPASVESFYQEAGRAGRDRERAECYILYCVSDKERKLVEEYSNSGRLLELMTLSDTAVFKRTDLGTILYFYNINHLSEASETKYTFKLLQRLKEIGPSLEFQQTNFQRDDFKQRIEHALYKLYLLGFVDDWTVNYFDYNGGVIEVQTKCLSEISTLDTINRFLTYVRKYDVEFSLHSERGLEYQTLFEQDDDQIKNTIQMLVRWTNQNILYQRLQCSKTIMDWCNPSVDSKTFRRNLEGYFRFSEETITFEYIAYHPTDFGRWFDVLYELNQEKTERTSPITKDAAIANLASLQRFLESFQNNTGLNYIDGLLQLLTKDSLTDHDLDRMRRSLKTVKTSFSPEEQTDIVRRTATFGRSIDNLEKRDLLSKVLIDFFPEMASIIFREMNDRYSLSVELEKGISRLENIKWII